MMQFLIITSLEDKASMNIRDKFLRSKSYTFNEIELMWHDNPIYKLKSYSLERKKNNFLDKNQVYLGLTRESLIFLNDLKLKKQGIDPDLLIFASRHASQTARPAFLSHITGNWGENADFGGNPRDLSHASALFLKAGFLSLVEQTELLNLTNFSLDIEVTHHGPTILEKPLIFMELGSSKEEWGVNNAGEVVANAIINGIIKYLEFKKDKTQKIGVGFGGMHYAPQFKKLIINKNVAVSFICPKYHIQDLNKEMIEQMINKNLEMVDYFIIDWKGTNSADKKHLIPLLEEFDIPIKKAKDF